MFGPTLLIPEEQLDDIGGALQQIKISQQVITILQTYGLDLDAVNIKRSENSGAAQRSVSESESQEEMLERLKGIMGDSAEMNARFSTMPGRGTNGRGLHRPTR